VKAILDPTAGEALANIQKVEKQALRAFRPIVYICSPYSGDVEGNVDAARRYSRFAVDKGYIPIAPHLLFPQFLDDAARTNGNWDCFLGMPS
jgi:hypothetical protein